MLSTFNFGILKQEFDLNKIFGHHDIATLTEVKDLSTSCTADNRPHSISTSSGERC